MTKPPAALESREPKAAPVMSATAIACPGEVANGCHLLLRIARSSGAVEAVHASQLPIKAVHAAANALYVVDGVSFARITVSTLLGDPTLGNTVQLESSLGDFRDAAPCDAGLAFVSQQGLQLLPLGTSAVRTIAQLPDAWQLACHGANVVLTTDVAGVELGSVERVEIESGKREQLARAQKPGAVAVDEQGVYWASRESDGRMSIHALLAGSSNATTLASGEHPAHVLATDEAQVYWLSDAPDGRHLCSIAKAGGSVRELLHVPAAQGTRSEEQLRVHANQVYLLAAGKLERVRTDGTEATVVAQTVAGGRIAAFAVSADHVYTVAEFSPAQPFTSQRSH